MLAMLVQPSQPPANRQHEERRGRRRNLAGKAQTMPIRQNKDGWRCRKKEYRRRRVRRSVRNRRITAAVRHHPAPAHR